MVTILLSTFYYTKSTFSYKTKIEMDLLGKDHYLEEHRASKYDQTDGHYLLIQASPKILKKLQSKYGGFIMDDLWRSEVY